MNYEKFFNDDFIMIEDVENKAAEIAEGMRQAKQKELEEVLADLKRRGFEIPYEMVMVSPQ